MFSVLLGSVWILLRGEIRPLWPWQGLVLLCHDASIAPYACLLPGPKTICCKLHYGLLRLICCLRTWCDWVSIHTTPLKLPASWPGHQQWQLQYRTVGAAWSVLLLQRGNLLSALWSSTSPLQSLEGGGQTPPAALTYHHICFYCSLVATRSWAAHSVLLLYCSQKQSNFQISFQKKCRWFLNLWLNIVVWIQF